MPLVLYSISMGREVGAQTIDVNPPKLPKSQQPQLYPPRSPEQQLTVPSLPEQPTLQVSPPTTPSTEPTPAIGQAVTVIQYEFEGNTAFTDIELAEAIALYTNRPISFAELLQAEASITQKYRDAGYLNSGAVILAGQTLEPDAAVVTIQVIEGGVDEIIVTGTERLEPSYVSRRLKRATDNPLNQQQLLEALQLLQLDPLIQTISADLSAGTRPESGILTVTVTEADSFHAEVFADNYRSPSVGTFRRGVTVSQDNLSGEGDRLAVSYANTNGSNAANLHLEYPINARNGTVGLGIGGSLTRITELPKTAPDVTGNHYFIDLTYRQPILQSPSQELALGVTASYQTSQTKIDGVGLANFPEGSNEKGRSRVTTLRFFQDWIKRNPRDVLALRSQFNLGLDLLGATSNRDRNDPLDTTNRPDGRFLSWTGQAQYARRLAKDSLFIARSNLQLSTDNLLSEEEFSLGGFRTVRGYRQNLLQTDNAFSASVEARFPIWRVNSVDGLLQIAPFFDAGVAWNHISGDTPDTNTLAGLGVGLQWNMWQDRLRARFDWGIPLIDIEGEKRSLQEQGLYFSISYRP